MKHIITGILTVAVLVLGLTAVGYAPYHTQQPPPQPAAAAGGAKTQIDTAVTHSGFAATGTSLAYVQQHLGHALNCIEGKGGKNFNASWGNVCEGQGNGILNDIKGVAGSAALMPLLEHADALALAGVRSGDLAAAKAAAQGTNALLKVVAEHVK